MTDILLTPIDVARYLKLSKSKVYYLIQRRQIPHIKIGRNVRVKQSDGVEPVLIAAIALLPMNVSNVRRLLLSRITAYENSLTEINC